MILLSENCLLFQTDSGESIPYTAENLSVEVLGDAAGLFDTEFIKHAAAAVFHYYRDELGRDTVTVAEFSLSLEKVLRGFKLAARESLNRLADRRTMSRCNPTLCSGSRRRSISTPVANYFSSRACAANSRRCSSNARTCFASRDCVRASSNSPARAAGARVARTCRIKSSNFSARACRAKTAASTARW